MFYLYLEITILVRRCGRPSKDEGRADTKQTIIDTAIKLIKEKGADYITVRNVCSEAGLSIGTFYHYFRDKDDLMMYFLRETSFTEIKLKTDIADVPGRISELYMHLINRYMELGLDFMKSFYSTGNKSLSAYMGETEGSFDPDTVMARCETELLEAQNAGYLDPSSEIHTLSMDICTIVKGCVFEWCLNDGTQDIKEMLERIISSYLFSFIK